MNIENQGSVSDAGGAPASDAPATEAPAPDAGGAAGEQPVQQDDAETALAREFGQVDEPAPDADTGDAGGDSKPPEGEEKPKGKSAQERIDELTAQAREAERRAAEAERLLAERNAAKEDPAPAASDADAGTPAEGEPDPANYEYGEVDAQFIKDSAAFHARAEFQRQENLRKLETEFQTIETTYAQRAEAAVERYPDFNEKVVEGAKSNAWDATPVMALAMKTSEQGPDVAYYLATNPAESKRIASLSPLEQAREMGRLEGRFTRQETPAPKKVSDAPAPPTTVTRGAGGQFKVGADTDDFAAFDKAY